MTDETSGPGVGRGPAHERPEVWAPRLERVLTQQADLYAGLDALGAQQRSLIEGGKTDELIELLGRRQAMIEQITALNSDVEPFTRCWDELAARLEEPQRERIRGQIDRLQETIDRITARDEADRRLLEQRKAKTADDLNSISGQRRAVAAYGSPPGSHGSGPRFQDREG